MSENSFENRLESLEEQVRDILGALQNGQSNGTGGKDWRRSLGMFDNDALMKEIDRAGQDIRSQEREQVANDHS